MSKLDKQIDNSLHKAVFRAAERWPDDKEQMLQEISAEVRAEAASLINSATQEARSLLKEWMEAFDDDGNLDGYGRDYIKDLQKRTYLALKDGRDD